jgi:DnaJ-class molecular chaperone
VVDEGQLELIADSTRNARKCPECKGTGMLSCPVCDGSGEVEDED